MSKKILFHGTTFENYRSIVENGFNPQNQNWYCSSSRDIYFFDIDKAESGDNNDEKRQWCIQSAFESAQLAAATSKSKSEKIIVIEIEINSKYVFDDESCENMASIASCVDIDFLNKKLAKVKAVYEADYNPNLSLFVIAHLTGSNFNINTNKLTSSELKACDIISKSGFYMEKIMEFDWIKIGDTFVLDEPKISEVL